jgi:hypothetical protein
MTVLYKNTKYKVTEFASAIGEDGKYGRPGYAVVNLTTGVPEATGTVLPQIITAADYYENVMNGIEASDKPAAVVEDDVTLQ